MTEGRALIIGSAPCGDWGFLRRYLRGDEYVIAADGGRTQAGAAGVTPHWYVGDGDSGGSPEGIPSAVLPAEKDWTDLEVAIHHALALGYRELLLTGCTGGRFDHYFANCCLLEEIAARGGRGMIVDEVNEIRLLLPGRTVVENVPPYRYLGILPLDRLLTGLTLRGAKYPLTGATVHRGTTLTVSNEILPGERAEITLAEGRALLVRSEPLPEE